MKENAEIQYFCCEDTFIVRVIAEKEDYVDTLEYYEPRVSGWILKPEWYDNMFVSKKIKFKKITREEAKKCIDNSIKYYRRTVRFPVYLRRIYDLYMDRYNPKTDEWELVRSDDWENEMSDSEKVVPVSEEEVFSYINNNNNNNNYLKKYGK